MADKYEVGKAYVQVIPSAEGFGSKLESEISGEVEAAGENAGSGFGAGFGKAAKTLATAAVAATAAASAAVVGFAKSAVNTGMEFDSAMSQVVATMGFSVEDLNNAGSEASKAFESLRGTALEYGASTSFSATQAAEALNYMALAGWDVTTSQKMLPTILDLAAAGSMDLASASDMVTDSQSALGLTLDETSAMVDQMAAASSKSNTSVSQLGEAFLKIGATARNVKGGTVELSTVLGVLADNGIKGAEGGTHLRNILLSLQNAAKDGKVNFGDFNVELYDADGNMRSLVDVIGDMQDGMEGMTQEAKDATVSGVFNKTDLAAINALLGTTSERFDELTLAIEGSEGAAKRMADVQLDNLAGDITIFKSALEGAKIAVSDNLTPSIREFVQFGTEGVTQLTKAFQGGGLTEAAGAFGDILAEGIGKLSEAGPSALKAGKELMISFLDGVKNSAPELARSAAEMGTELVDGLAEGIPAILETGAELAGNFITGIAGKIPQIATEIVPAFADNLGEALSSGISTVLGGFGDLVAGVIENLPEISINLVSAAINIGADVGIGLTEGIIDAGASIIGAVGDVFTGAWDSTGNLVLNLFEGAALKGAEVIGIISGSVQEGRDRLEQLDQKVAENIITMGLFQDALDGIRPNIADSNDLVSASGATLSGLNSQISTVENQITNTLSTALAEQQQLRADDIVTIESYLQQMVDLGNEKMEIYRINQTAELVKLKYEADTITNEGLQQHIVNIEEALAQANQAAQDSYDAEVSQLTAYYSARGMLDSEEFAEEMANLIANRDAQLATNQEYANEALLIAQQKGTDLIAEDWFMWDELQQLAQDHQWTMQDDVEGFLANFVDSMAGGATDAKISYMDVLTELQNENANAFFNMLAETVSSGGEITEENKQIADTILSCYEGLPDSMQETALNLMLGLIGGMQDEIPELGSTAGKSADEIVEMLRNTLDIHSPSGVAKTIGSNVGKGLVNGLSGTKSEVTSTSKGIGTSASSGISAGLLAQEASLMATARAIAYRLTSTIKSALQIHSPSKLWEDEIGEMLGEGIGVGFVGSMDKVTDDMIDALPTAELVATSRQQLTGQAALDLSSDQRIDTVVELLAMYLPTIAAWAGYTLDGELVGKKLAGPISEELNRMKTAAERGRTCTA